MKTSDAVKHFGSKAAAGRAAGVTKSAASQWGELVPERLAYRLERATNGVLKVDPALYRRAA